MIPREKLDEYRQWWTGSHVAIGPLIIKLLDDIDERIEEIDRLTKEIGRLHMERTDGGTSQDDE